MNGRLRRLAPVLGLVACSPAGVPLAPVATKPQVVVDVCARARAWRQEAARLVEEHRPQRALRRLADADEACPRDAADGVAARDRANALLGSGTQSMADALRAHAERRPDAQLLLDRALARAERDAGRPASVYPVFDQPLVDLQWLPGHENYLLRRTGSAFEMVDATNGDVTLLDGADIQVDPTGLAGKRCVDGHAERVDFLEKKSVRLPFPCLNEVAFSSDGQILAGEDEPRENERTVTVATGTGKVLLQASIPGYTIRAFGLTPAGDRLFVDGDESIGIWDVESAKRLELVPRTWHAGSMTIELDRERRLLGWIDQDAVQLYDLVAKKRLAPIKALPECSISVFAFHPDEPAVVTLGAAPCVRPIGKGKPRVIGETPPKTAQPKSSKGSHNCNSCSLWVGPHARTLIYRVRQYGSGDWLIDGTTGETILPRPSGPDTQAEASEIEAEAQHTEHGRFLVLHVFDELRVVDAEQARFVHSIPLPHTEPLEARLAMHPDGRSVFFQAPSVGALWIDLETGKNLAVQSPSPATATFGAVLVADRIRFRMRRYDLQVDAKTGKPLRLLPDGAAADLDDVVWDPMNGTLRWPLHAPPREVVVQHGQRITASPDRSVVLVSGSGRITAARPDGIVWTFVSGTSNFELVFAGDGRSVAALAGDVVHVLDAKDGHERRMIKTPDARSIALSWDAEMLAVTTSTSIELYAVSSGQPFRTIDRVLAGGFGVSSISKHGILVGGAPQIWDPERSYAPVPLEPPAPFERDRVIGLDDDSTHVIVGSPQGVSFFALPSGTWTGAMVPMRRSTILFSRRGLVEVIGEASEARGALRCRIGDRLFPFALCEDRVTETGLVESIVAAP